MWHRLVCLCAVLLLTVSTSVQAAFIPYYRMDSLAFLSEVIVLCQELSITTGPVGQADTHLTATRVRCRVLQAFKGELAAGAEIEVEYNLLYDRALPCDDCGTYVDSKGKVLRVIKPQILPPGRALLFLRSAAAGSMSWAVVGAKLIHGEEVFQFGQFRSNPGGLVLALQRPENIRLAPAERYDSARLIEDLRAALRNTVTLKEAVRMNAFDAAR